MIDNYSHNDPNILYIMENIPGPFEDSTEYNILMENYNSQMVYNCTCSEMCSTVNCKCLNVSHGRNYDSFMHYGIIKYKLKLNQYSNYSILECNSNCTCKENCGNRIVQKGPMEGLVVKLCENEKKGSGLFSSVHVRTGTFICEYAGELLTKSQAMVRSKNNDELNEMNFIFCLNEYVNDEVIQTFVDPKKFGNIGRYINHSCDPNCFIVPVRYENAVPHLAVFAAKDVFPGTEITFSYGVGSEVIGESQAVQKQKSCLCNSENCNGFMPFDNF